jgi:hypothetical protein
MVVSKLRDPITALVKYLNANSSKLCTSTRVRRGSMFIFSCVATYVGPMCCLRANGSSLLVPPRRSETYSVAHAHGSVSRS